MILRPMESNNGPRTEVPRMRSRRHCRGSALVHAKVTYIAQMNAAALPILMADIVGQQVPVCSPQSLAALLVAQRSPLQNMLVSTISSLRRHIAAASSSSR